MNNEEIIRVEFPDNEYVEGVVSYPLRMGDAGAVLLCPPHPHFAGNMDNNVIRALYSYLSAKGAPVMRFNYRGVGRSALNLRGDLSIFDYWNDVEENKNYAKTIEDTEACLRTLSEIAGGQAMTVIGYSFGAIMAMLTGLKRPDVKRVIGIAPPLSAYDFSSMNSRDKQTYLIGSSGDFVYEKSEFLSLCEGMGHLRGYEFFNGCDHFFRGREGDLAEAVWKFMEDENKSASNGGKNYE